jgi:hypothetical protein
LRASFNHTGEPSALNGGIYIMNETLSDIQAMSYEELKSYRANMQYQRDACEDFTRMTNISWSDEQEMPHMRDLVMLYADKARMAKGELKKREASEN